MFVFSKRDRLLHLPILRFSFERICYERPALEVTNHDTEMIDAIAIDDIAQIASMRDRLLDLIFSFSDRATIWRFHGPRSLDYVEATLNKWYVFTRVSVFGIQRDDTMTDDTMTEGRLDSSQTHLVVVLNSTFSLA